MAREKDKIMRKNLAKPSVGTLGQILGLEVHKAETMSPVLIQTIIERNADNLMLLLISKSRSLILHWEYQVNNDTEMVVRNAIYDYLIYKEHKIAVMTIVLYIGRGPLTMKKDLDFCGNHYSCEIIDIRNLDPEIFLQSTDYKEVIMAVLAGPDDLEEKRVIIKRIITKLRQMLSHSDIEFTEKIKELDYLAQVRGKRIQQLIKKEVSNMNWVEALGLDKTKSLYYQEARRETRKETKQEDALNFIKAGVDLAIIHKCTGLSLRMLTNMQKKIAT